MEIINKKILLENGVDRRYNSSTWGQLTATTFYVDVLITQNIDDMGLFSDTDFVPSNEIVNQTPDYSVLTQKLLISGYTFPFMYGITPKQLTGITGTTKLVLRLTSATESDYYDYGNLIITGSTESKIEDLRSYDKLNPYKVGFDMDKTTYIDYSGGSVNGVSRITSISNPKIYVFDAEDDSKIGGSEQNTGIRYQDFNGDFRFVDVNPIQSSNFNFIGQGWNQTNLTLSALTKEEYLFGIISPPEVQSDINVDRGITTVMEKHLKLSEIKNMGDLSRYGNGFYKLRNE
jgi:hypothetical protein